MQEQKIVVLDIDPDSDQPPGQFVVVVVLAVDAVA